MRDNSLSVCMIVKDEAHNIERCLNSVKNIAEEIIVVDTGSVDNTIEKAKELGAIVIEHKWNKDFSEARNKSLDYATKSWILILDADEMIPEEDGMKLKEILANPDECEGYYVRLVNIVADQEQGDSIVFRIVKNDPDYRFVGKMHEQIIQSVENKKGINRVGSTDVRILHDGYDPGKADLNAKSRRNIELLEGYEESKKDGYYYYSLGNEYSRIGDIKRGMQTYEKAFEVTKFKRGAMPIYYTYLMKSILMVHQGVGEWSKALKAIKKFKIECPDFKDLYFYEALAYINTSRFSKAREAIAVYQKTEKGQYAYPDGGFETQYDIANIIQQLEQAKVPHQEKLISVLMVVDQYEPSILETIKSVNEIAYEVLVLTEGLPSYGIEEIENLGATILESKQKEHDKKLISGSKKCKGKYLLIIEPKEICSAQAQREIVNLLTEAQINKSNIEGYSLYQIARDNTYTGKSLRIIKNNRRLNNLRSFSRYNEEVAVEQTMIHIHEFYVFPEPRFIEVSNEGSLPFDFAERTGAILDLVKE